MKRPAAHLAALIMFAATSCDATVLFRDSADLADFTIANTSATATISRVAGSSSALDGDAIFFSDTDGKSMPGLFYQTDVPLSGVLKISFDVINFSTPGPGHPGSPNSNLVFRIGPKATEMGKEDGKSVVSSLGINLTPMGRIAVESGSMRLKFERSYTMGKRFNVTIFYNRSKGDIDLSGLGGPPSLAPNQWALYIDGKEKSSTLSERASQDYGSGFGFAWLSGNAPLSNTINAQIDNIEYTTLEFFPQ